MIDPSCQGSARLARRIPLLLPAILAVAASTCVEAGVIGRTCLGQLTLGGQNYIRAAQGGPPPYCAANLNDGFFGTSGSHQNPNGGYTVSAQQAYESNFVETESGFQLSTSLSGNGTLAVYNGFPGVPEPEGGWTSATGGFLMRGRADDSFSVTEPYNFTLNYYFDREVGGSWSRNFLDPDSADESLIPLVGIGVRSGLLLPGQTYRLHSAYDTGLSGSNVPGQITVFTTSFGGLATQLKATAVPLPGTSMLVLPGLALIFSRLVWRRRYFPAALRGTARFAA